MIALDYWYVGDYQYKDHAIAYVPALVHVLAEGRYRTLNPQQEKEEEVVSLVRKEEKKKEKREKVLEVYFGFDSYRLSQKEKEKLLKLDREKTYFLVGHADWIGKEGYNLRLSQRRAKSVEKYLNGLNLKVEGISSKGEEECRIKKELEGKVRVSGKLIKELQPCRKVEVFSSF